jgi:hypothetical protein
VFLYSLCVFGPFFTPTAGYDFRKEHRYGICRTGYGVVLQLSYDRNPFYFLLLSGGETEDEVTTEFGNTKTASIKSN